jgi:hypothetical protein
MRLWIADICVDTHIKSQSGEALRRGSIVSQAILDQCAAAYVAFRMRRRAARRQGIPELPWLEFREARRNVPVELHVGTARREWNPNYGRRWME